MQTYSGAWPVMPTPYNENLQIDCAAYRALVDWYIQRGSGGVYANCLSSEMYALDESERLLLVSEAVEAAGGRTPVAATGNFGPSVEAHTAFCRRVAGAGADVVMLVIPEFIRDDAELETYLFTLAEQVDAPLGLYECPYPRRYHLGVDLVRKLAASGRFYAYKETACQLDKIRALAEACAGTPLAYLQANTPYLLDSVRLGAPGSMSIAAGWVPDLVAAVIDLARREDPAAEQMQAHLSALELAERAVHPLGLKFLLARRGLPVSMRSRTAKDPLSEETIRALETAAQDWFDAQGDLRLLSS
jgi:4-hydroxy-tetrahydrodipicolinate synthase